MYSWIAIESILKVEESIRANIIPNEKERNILNLSRLLCSLIIYRNAFYSLAKSNYIHLVESTQNHDNYFGLSSGTIESARLNLKAGERNELAALFKNLPNIIAEMNDEVYKSDLIRLEEFYKDKKGLVDFKKQVCNDMTLIYRLRNLIAHNAVYSPYQTKLYAYKAQFICGSLIHAIRYFCNRYKLGLDDAVLRIYTECTLFEDKIETHIKSMKGL